MSPSVFREVDGRITAIHKAGATLDYTVVLADWLAEAEDTLNLYDVEVSDDLTLGSVSADDSGNIVFWLSGGIANPLAASSWAKVTFTTDAGRTEIVWLWFQVVDQ